ncbi:hypothetical protein GOP47_0010284 [Adiantum capillus-veneris]|uniref:Dioxygenase n=1 Tax=Adiantum capillus-veneris TaxID=13818 RepID=A0A9D4UUF7_ADICA|nr:hypothetical protein GOP47_0010284 [Adiantum capillus-veneris]
MATVACVPFATAVAHKSKVERGALQAGIRCELAGDGHISTSSFHHRILQDTLSHSTKMITGLMNGAKNAIVQATVDTLFKDSKEVNIAFEGNFGPVDEIGSRVPLEVIDGAIPFDFPTGVYIRNGPNPQFGGKIKNSPFGRLNHHWFEGDGMLHATYFGLGGGVSYQNKYVETEGYREERKQGKQLWLNNIDGDPKAILMAYFFNQLRFNKVNKATCNTTIFTHNGRLFANAESDIPIEILPYNLESIGPWDVGKQWGRPFTSHPKIVQETGEMVIFGFSAMKPYYTTGVISADGKALIHTCDAELDIPMFSHELAITQNYDIIMYMPLTLDVTRAIQGKNLLKFDEGMQSKFGIKPRRGNASAIRWFPVESHYTFHLVNSYEEGDEVILHGCRARRSLLMGPCDMNPIEWFARGIDDTLVDESSRDPSIDGALFSTIHEWRFNLQTGLVAERDIITAQNSMEMPRINDKHLGVKYNYAYAQVVDHEASKLIGMPKYGRLAKLTLLEKHKGCNLELHDAGKDVFYSEPLFVPRPNSHIEDDGWVVTYVHNEKNNSSEIHILDAQNFSKPPVARIKLPQRVPYGFHSTFMHGLF